MNELLLENISHEDLKKHLLEFYSYALTKLNISRPPKLFFQKNQKNADNLFGKTGYYDPDREEIHLFTTDRHAKDIIRSFAHELIHHMQKLQGFDENVDLSKTGNDPAYATNDPKLRRMEEQAFLEGNMVFRDWTDMKKMEIKNMLNEKKLTPTEKSVRSKEAEKIKPSVKSTYGVKGDKAKGIAYAIATNLAKGKKAHGPGKPMSEVSYDISGLGEPAKADLDKNKDISGYEKARGKAIEKSMKEESNMKVSVNQNTINEVSDEETEEISDFRPKISRNLADVPETGSEEELELDAGEEEEDTTTGSKTPFKSKEQMAFEDKFGDMDSDTQARLLAYLAQKAKDKKAAKIALSAELNKAEREAEEAERRAKFASLPGTKPPMEEAAAALNETKQNPYPVLFEKKDRLLKETFNTREERIYNELIKRFIKK